jgi:hypothetical protein
MTCSKCVEGAKWNRAWRAGGGTSILYLAEVAHNQCTGCTCQHAIGADSLVVTPV